MVTSSYPRFPGDSVGTFMEPIATSIAARGHEVHVVAPWHPLVSRGPMRRTASTSISTSTRPIARLNVFGYAAALRADVSLQGGGVHRGAAGARGGLARRAARSRDGTARRSCTGTGSSPAASSPPAAAPALPLVVSLHGSDVYVAETFWPARRAARDGLRPRRRRHRVQRRPRGERAIALGADAGSRRSGALRRGLGALPARPVHPRADAARASASRPTRHCSSRPDGSCARKGSSI